MSEPERSDRGAITESPTLLPGHAAGPTERVEENQDAPEVAPSVEPNGSTSVGPTPRPPLLDEHRRPESATPDRALRFRPRLPARTKRPRRSVAAGAVGEGAARAAARIASTAPGPRARGKVAHANRRHPATSTPACRSPMSTSTA